ncbi:hypothetical protein BGZ97_010361 [Linnemannia gamsii]|uniref:Uncharacterized protein n=1 Tax=Linnemannia gamsii TaxID=64522 RepID=A0A9P6UVQ3_9FUNG|nr:hypothetical protein BGZ97_010361 [Linnemannia gamsii]
MQTLGIGANAAQLLANLATTPGYISDEAILEYSRRHQQQHTSQWQQPFSQSEPPSNQPQPYLAPTQYQQFQTQGYSQDFNRVQPSIQQSHDSRVSNDPNAAIGALLNELQQTGATASIATSTPSYPLYASIPPPQSQPQPLVPPPDIPSQSQSIQSDSEHRSPCASSAIQQPSQEQSGDDFSSGKITPQLLKKLAALAESDVQSGSTLLNEIKRLRSRQTKTERSLYEGREELLNKHKRDFVKLQASEIMGVNVENEMQRTKSVHREELKRFDQRVVRAMDKEITLVQESLAQAGVPLMFSTQDPGKIASQIRVLRLLEDMLQT